MIKSCTHRTPANEQIIGHHWRCKGSERPSTSGSEDVPTLGWREEWVYGGTIDGRGDDMLAVSLRNLGVNGDDHSIEELFTLVDELAHEYDMGLRRGSKPMHHAGDV
jgi:hypothetical protein